MNKPSTILTLVLILTGCFSIRNNLEPSRLLIEGKKRNGLIENRNPAYDNRKKDGCIVMGQISMDIEILNDRRIVGSLSDSKTNEPLLFSTLKLIFIDSDTLISITDSLGKFDIQFSDELMKIQTENIGFKTLTIDLTKKK